MRNNAVNNKDKNLAFIKLIADRTQILTIDTNFLLPPDRSKLPQIRPVPFDHFKRLWLEPLIYTFPNLTIHEAVYKEIQSVSVSSYIDSLATNIPPSLRILSDAIFSEKDEIFRQTAERAIAYYTDYDPDRDNAADRGEVKSLAHIVTSSLLYFCSHDSNALRLIENAEELETNLDEIGAIKTYEVIYYLLKFRTSDIEGLRYLYKYMYYLTKSEKAQNPSWNDFIIQMDLLYIVEINNCSNKPTPLNTN